MNKFIQNNQKKFMALFGVVLMVAFVVPYGSQMASSADRAVGKVGKDKITAGEIRNAQDQLQLLSQRVVVQGQQQDGSEQWTMLIRQYLPNVTEASRANPEIYALLQHEARALGIFVSAADVDRQFAAPNVAILTEDGAKVPLADLSDANLRDNIRIAMANAMAVHIAFENATLAVKVSEPLLNHDMASRFQQVKLSIVDFAAKDYESKVPQPSEAQLQDQFQKFANVSAGMPDAAGNPFGFGYKFSDRVKLQYVGIPHREVRRVVQSAKDDYAWEVDANRYYLKHQSDFPATAPATTQPFAEKTTPTTQPFAAVRQEIINRLIDPEADKLQREIQSEIAIRFTKDFQTFQAKTAQTPAYDSFEYLQSVANEIQSRFHVTPTIAAVDQFKSAEELRALPNIGQVNAFADYAVAAYAGFAAKDSDAARSGLTLHEFSKPLSDASTGDAYLFRISAADASHAPTNLAEVRDQVVYDVRHLAAYQLAKADAQAALIQARDASLRSAAGDRPVITTGDFSLSVRMPVPNYTVTSKAMPEFVRGTSALLSTLNRSAVSHPINTIELPSDWKIAVTELDAVRSFLTPQIAQLYRPRITQELIGATQGLIYRDWFDFNAVSQRLGYVDLQPKSPKSAAGI